MSFCLYIMHVAIIVFFQGAILGAIDNGGYVEV